MENKHENNKKFGSKKKIWSILPIAFSGILAGGAIAGAAVSVWHVSQNYINGPEFIESSSGQIKVDPHLSDPTNKAEATQAVKECADRLSMWLRDQGQKWYDVSYEVRAEGSENYYYGYLSTQFSIDQVEPKIHKVGDDEKTKILNDPYLSFFDLKGFNSNEKTLVYRWYIDNPSPDRTTKPQYTVIPFKEMFNIPQNVSDVSTKIIDDNTSKPLTDNNGNPGVVFSLKDEYKTKLTEIYEDLNKAYKDSTSKEEEEKEEEKEEESEEEEDQPKTIQAVDAPRIYIVNNLDNFYNEINYHLAFWWANHDNAQYLQWYKETDYEKFCSHYASTSFNGDSREVAGETKERFFKLSSAPDRENNSIPNLDLFNYVDPANPATLVYESILSKYVEKIITKDDFTEYMPKEINDEIGNQIEEGNNKINNFWYKTATFDDAKTYLNKQIKYGFKSTTIVSFDTNSVSEIGVAGAQIMLDKINNVWMKRIKISPSFTETLFGKNNIISVLSIGFLIFLALLLIILTFLYRTTGLFSWICMLFALSITLLISTLASPAISMALVLGLFTLAIAGFIASINICERMKRRLLSDEDTQLILKRTFSKSLLPIVDISIIVLVFGICITYMTPITLNALGVSLIIGGFSIFICMYLLNGLLHGLFFSNRIMINRFQFFGKPSNVANLVLMQSNSEVPASLDATSLNFAFYSSMSKKKIDITNKKAIIAISIVAGILLASIILYSVLGIVNSSMLHTSNCLAIYSTEDVIAKGWVDALEYVSYQHDATNNWWYFYTNNNYDQIVQALGKLLIPTETSAPILVEGQNMLIQYIVGTSNIDILNWSLLAIVVATVCSSVYAIIRFNWIAFVPMFMGAFAIPFIFLGLSAAFQIKFDQYVILGFILVTLINTIITSNVLCSINETWSRKDPYSKNEFAYIVNTSFKNDWTMIWTTGLAYLFFLVIFAICSPTGTSSLFMIGVLIIGCIVSLIVTPFAVSFLLYQFMNIRNVVLNAIVEKNKNKVVINYDKVDEQEIEGINKFVRRIPISNKDTTQQ